MKKKSLFKMIVTYFMHIMLMLLMIVPSLSWLGNTIAANLTESSKVQGSTSDQAYFGGGDGSIDNPYIISDRIHLYNMAWLQYIGFFNLGPANNGRVQNYFKVTSDIDMSSLAIPAIGTTQYPFMGHFDGQGYVINNCVTANASEILKNHPDGAIFNDNGLLSEYFSTEQQVKNEATQIIGFFGVLGDYSGELNDLISKGTNIVRIDSKDEYLTHADSKTTIYTAEIGITSFGLYNYSIKNNSSNTLVGLIAGYANATISDCKAGNATLNASAVGGPFTTSLTENISDHLLVGHCTSSYEGVLNVSTLTGYQPSVSKEKYTAAYTSEGGANGWGGSMDINSLYNNIKTDISNNTSSISNYVYQSKTLVSNGGGNTTVTKTSSKAFYSLNNANKDEFNMVVTSRSSIGNFDGLFDNNGYLYVTGGHKNLYIEYEQNSNTYDKFTISQTETNADSTTTTMYLNLDGAYEGSVPYDLTIESGTNANQATYWAIDSAPVGGIYTGNVFTVVNGIPYYLSIGTVMQNNQMIYRPVIVNTPPPDEKIKWTRIDNNLYITYGSANYFLYYEGGEWRFYTSYFSYYITDGNGNYLTLNNDKNGYTNSTDQTKATIWNFETPNLAGEIYTVVDGTTYFLTFELGSITVNGSSKSWINDNNKLKGRSTIIFFPVDTYIRYNGGWETTRRSNYATTLTFIKAEVDEESKPDLNLSFSQNGKFNSYTFTKRTEDLEFPNNGSYNSATYIPLQLKYENSTYSVLDSNTGYITSGSWEDESSATLQSFPYRSGDIRISQYQTSKLGDYTSKVRTIIPGSNSSYSFGDIPVNDYQNNANYQSANLQRYSDSVSSYQALVSGTNLYGIHFMDGRINMDSLVTIPSAKINGASYANYQVPADCIDFSFKEKGYINFFAGTYYSYTGVNESGAQDTLWNDSFFSFHRIIRNDDNTIKEIKEISKIFESSVDRTLECYYLYTDGTYEYYDRKQKVYTSATKVPDDYVMTFDMDWIKNPGSYESGSALINNAAYYFEVPASPGEYALGCAEGRVGGYLLYLDIAANAQEVERTVTYDFIKETVSEYTYAKGVEFASQDGVYTEGSIASIILNGSYNGEITVNRNGNEISIAGANIASTGMIGAASGVSISGISNVKPPTNSIAPVVTRIVTIIDFNSTTKVTTKIVITKVGNGTPIAKVYVKNEGEDIFTYDEEKSGLVINADGSSDNQTLLDTPKDEDIINWDYDYSDRDIQFEYVYDHTQENEVTNNIEFNMDVVTDANTSTTTTNYSYDITITSNEDIVITITELKTTISVTDSKGVITNDVPVTITFIPTGGEGGETPVTEKGTLIIVATPPNP